MQVGHKMASPKESSQQYSRRFERHESVKNVRLKQQEVEHL